MSAWIPEANLRRALLATAAIVVISALLFRAAVPPVHACVCVGAPLEEHVAAADAILTGNGTEFFTEPPLDPATPDNLDHRGSLRFSVDEYLKGQGPAELTLITNTVFYFNDDGTLAQSFTDCDLLLEGSVGRRYILFLKGSLDGARDPGFCGGSFALTGSAGADEYVERVRQILQATPTPNPSPAPTTSAPTTAPTAVALASVTPLPLAALPATGGGRQEDDAMELAAFLAAGSLIVAAGALVYRRLAR